MSEDKFELQGDYTESEKAKQAKKEKKSLAAKKHLKLANVKRNKNKKKKTLFFGNSKMKRGTKIYLEKIIIVKI